MRDAHAHPTFVVRQVVDAVGNRLAQFLVWEIVHPHFDGSTTPAVLAAAVLEIPDQFLLFRVHGDDRLAPTPKPLGQPIDVLELGVAVRMRLALSRLAIGLQAEPGVVEQTGYGRVADGAAS